MPKLPAGKRAYINGREFRGEVPEVYIDLLPKELFKKTTITKPAKPKVDSEVKA